MATDSTDTRFQALMAALDHAFDPDHDHDDLHQLVALDVVTTALKALRDRHLLDLIGLGYDHSQIADALHITRAAVTQQVSSARRRERDRRAWLKGESRPGGGS